MPQRTLHGAVKTYSQTRVLNGAGLALRRGEVHVLMGKNGAGKSTLIRVLAGLATPDAGTILLNNAPLRLTSPADAGLRFLHQELHIIPGLPVAENMHLSHPYPTRLAFVRWAALGNPARTWLAHLGVTHINPRQPVADLGPGDQLLARIAATLIAVGAKPYPR